MPQPVGVRAALAPQRHAAILDAITRDGAVRVSDLTHVLGVSDMTVRRDLDLMERRGLLTKVHGGATGVAPEAAQEPGFEAKSSREQGAKRLIAQRAAELVRPHSAIALTAGTTTWALAHELVDVPGLTIVTNSPRVAGVLQSGGRADQTVILTGGVRTPSDALVGPLAVAAIRSLHVETVFMGVHGLHPTAGATTPNVEEAETNRAFAASGRHLVVVADETKWGVVALSGIVGLHEIGVWVVDRTPPLTDLAQVAPDLILLTPDGNRPWKGFPE